MDDDEIYLIWSHEHHLWWGPDGCGYTQQMSQAGRYTRAQALAICAKATPGTSLRMGALPELPVRLSDLNEMVARYQAKFPWREKEPWL